MEENQKFENEDYSAEVSFAKNCRLNVKVSVKPQAMQKIYQKAVKQVNKQISIPGFRKGHAPDRTVISRYSSYVETEWKELVVNNAYRAALDLTQIFPLNKESIDKPKVERCSLEEGALVQLSYEHYPRIPQIDFSQLTIPAIEQEVTTEEQIDGVIEEIRKQHADWEDIQDRAVESGDYVDITIHSLKEDHEIVKESRFEVSDKRLPSWLKAVLLGMQANQSIETVSALDEEAEAEVKERFEPTEVRITLHAIKKIILPAVDDELAKKAGGESLETLRSRIRTKLEKQAEEEKKRKEFAALDEVLLTHTAFDLPSSLMEKAVEERMEDELETLDLDSLSEEEIIAKEEALEKEIALKIERELRLYFINKQIALQGNLSLSQEELNEELVRYILQNPHLFSQEDDAETKREFISRVKNGMMERKTKEYALAQLREFA